MYTQEQRFAQYKRGVIYFIVYSAILFFLSSTEFLSLKTLLYFFLGFTLSGAITAIFMNVQYKVEKKLNPNFWILNIVIEIVGYYLFTHGFFYLIFELI